MQSFTEGILIISFTEKRKDGVGTHIYINLLQRDPFPDVYKKFCEKKKIVCHDVPGHKPENRFIEALKKFNEIHIESDDIFIMLEKNFSINYEIYKKNILFLQNLLLSHTKKEVVFLPLKSDQ